MIPTLYGQRDPRWANQKINGTQSTIGHYGCTISCLAMLFSLTGVERNPGEMELYLRSLKAFKDDLIVFAKIPHFVERFHCENSPAPTDRIREYLAAGQPVLANVHLGSGAPQANHWILIIDQDFTVQDPWYNERVNITHRYGRPETAILGGAYFNLPMAAPDTSTGTPPAQQVCFPGMDAYNEAIFQNIFIAYFGSWPNVDQINGYRSYIKTNGGEPYTAFQKLYLDPDRQRATDTFLKSLSDARKDSQVELDAARKQFAENLAELKQQQAEAEIRASQAVPAITTPAIPIPKKEEGSFTKFIRAIVNAFKGE